MDSDLLPPVLIEDDGELEEVRRTLDALEIPYAESIGEPLLHTGLLISNARCALARGEGAGVSNGSGRFQIVVADKVSGFLQRELRRLRPDFLLQRPVDPVSLRLLVLHALYGGPERRRSERAAMCAVVKYRSRLLTRKATLVDLSQRGCRLLTRRELQAGERLSVTLPRELTGNLGLTLEGRVLVALETEDGQHAISVTFGPLDAESSHAVRYVMATQAVGAAPMQPRTHAAARMERAAAVELASPAAAVEPAAPTAAGEPAPPAAAERRSVPRARFQRPISAIGRDGSRVLLGRDLSVRGMRVAPDWDLAIGKKFDLVIHAPGERRHTVRAVVERDDGDAGCLLRFEGLTEAEVEALAEVVASLPSLAGTAGDAAPTNVVVSEWVERG